MKLVQFVCLLMTLHTAVSNKPKLTPNMSPWPQATMSYDGQEVEDGGDAVHNFVCKYMVPFICAYLCLCDHDFVFSYTTLFASAYYL